MKKIISLVAVVVFFAIAGISFASDKSYISQEIEAFETPLIEDAIIAKYAKMARKFFNSVDDYDTEMEIYASTRAPASPLSYLEVYAAISSNYPTYEYFGQTQFTSAMDHGGSQLYIVTVEIGYGFSPIAKIVGNTLTQVQQQPITDNSVVVGYFRWWDANGYQGGQFTYQNRSVNYPYNTMSDWITIQ